MFYAQPVSCQVQDDIHMWRIMYMPWQEELLNKKFSTKSKFLNLKSISQLAYAIYLYIQPR
jgi:hypothetical protein